MSFCYGLAITGISAAAQESTAGGPSTELAALLAALPKWSTSVATSSAFGFKDNLLLSSAQQERSAFARGSAQLVLLRMPYGQFDYSFSALAEGTRYFTTDTADQDAKVYLQTDPGFRVGDTLTFALPVTGYYYDKVFDVSDTEVERIVAKLKVKGVKVGPMVRWDFHPAWWLEAQAIGQRKRYDDGGNDGGIGEGLVRLGWAAGWFETRLSTGLRWRDFDRRVRYSASGRELPDTRLKIAERESEARFDISWDDAGRWQTITRASLLHYRDNGSGYFNYREQRVAQDVECRSAPWLLRVGGSASRIDFAVQTVGVGIDPPTRIKDEFTAEVYVERQVSTRLSLFANYSWERCRSNERILSYTVNESLLGVRWSWGK